MEAPVLDLSLTGLEGFLGSLLVPPCMLRRRISDNGLSSSKDTPVTPSTYSRSSTAIFGTGTAILTPFSLCR